MAVFYHLSIFIGIASAVTGLISFFASYKNAKRKTIVRITSIVFIITAILTLSMHFQQTTIASVALSNSPGTYIANGSLGHKIYFHNKPDDNTRRNAYINTQVEVVVQKVENDFGYISFTNTSGASSFGWIKMQYLIRTP